MSSYFIPGSDKCRMNVFDSAQEIAKSLNENVKDNADVWINLTNGIEILPHLLSRIPYKFCRFRSCSFEQKNWNDAIADMPDDMLMKCQSSMSSCSSSGIYDCASQNLYFLGFAS